MTKKADSKNLLSGLLILVVGGLVFLESMQYSIGTLNNMGPGFFPASLGAILAVLGSLIIINALITIIPENQVASSGFSMLNKGMIRGWGGLILGVFSFIFVGEYFGFVPATFAIVFISALGDKENSLKACFLLALATSIIGPAIFVYGLNMYFPLFSFGA